MLRAPIIVALSTALAEELTAQELVVLSHVLMMRCGNFPQEMYYGYIPETEVNALVAEVVDQGPLDNRVRMAEELTIVPEHPGAGRVARTRSLIDRQLRQIALRANNNPTIGFANNAVPVEAGGVLERGIGDEPPPPLADTPFGRAEMLTEAWRGLQEQLQDRTPQTIRPVLPRRT